MKGFLFTTFGILMMVSLCAAVFIAALGIPLAAALWSDQSSPEWMPIPGPDSAPGSIPDTGSDRPAHPEIPIHLDFGFLLPGTAVS
jgi:hypothetical protein